MSALCYTHYTFRYRPFLAITPVYGLEEIMKKFIGVMYLSVLLALFAGCSTGNEPAGATTRGR